MFYFVSYTKVGLFISFSGCLGLLAGVCRFCGCLGVLAGPCHSQRALGSDMSIRRVCVCECVCVCACVRACVRDPLLPPFCMTFCQSSELSVMEVMLSFFATGVDIKGKVSLF